MIAHIIWIVIIITLITFFIVDYSQQNALKLHLKNDAKTFSEILEDYIIRTMHQDKGKEAIPSILGTVAMLEHIKRIRLLKLNGIITFSSNLDEPGTLVKQNYLNNFIAESSEFERFDLSKSRDYIFLGLSDLNKNKNCQQCHATSKIVNNILWVETGDEKLSKAFSRKYLGLLGVAAGVILLLSVVTYFLFVRSIDRPINEIMRTMETLERGDFSARVNSLRRDELGQLANGMNTLAEKLQKAKEHLEEHHLQELQQAEILAKIVRMAAGLAHEIKNPISGIVFAINSILRETDRGDNKREIYEEIVKQANRVEQNLESLLAFARQSRFELVSTNLNDLVERNLLFIGQQPDMKLIETVSDLDDALPDVLVDPKQIEQVLLNLIINAIQAMPKGGKLTVSTWFDTVNNIVRITVEDTGEGIPKEIRDQIFQPFLQQKLRVQAWV